MKNTGAVLTILLLYGSGVWPGAWGATTTITLLLLLLQGMVDGSASKPALRQDTGYMVEKTYNDIAPYLGGFWGLFNASVTQIWFKRCFHIQK